MATREQLRQYEADKRQYEAELIRYQSDLQEWNKLSPQEKANRHKSAESGSRKFWSFLAGAAASFCLYFYFRQSFSGDTFWLVWGGTSAGVLVFALLISRILGLIVRAAFFSILSGAAAAIFFMLLPRVVENPPSQILANGITLALAAIVFLLSLTKASHADGAPSPPIPPTQPS